MHLASRIRNVPHHHITVHEQIKHAGDWESKNKSAHHSGREAQMLQDLCSEDCGASQLIGAVHAPGQHGDCYGDTGSESASHRFTFLSSNGMDLAENAWWPKLVLMGYVECPKSFAPAFASAGLFAGKTLFFCSYIYDSLGLNLAMLQLLPCLTRGEHLCRSCAWWEKPGCPGRTCEWCGAYQRLRAHHCAVCESCVDTHDHHCAWLGTCIGARNQAMYVL